MASSTPHRAAADLERRDIRGGAFILDGGDQGVRCSVSPPGPARTTDDVAILEQKRRLEPEESPS